MVFNPIGRYIVYKRKLYLLVRLDYSTGLSNSGGGD